MENEGLIALNSLEPVISQYLFWTVQRGQGPYVIAQKRRGLYCVS